MGRRPPAQRTARAVGDGGVAVVRRCRRSDVNVREIRLVARHLLQALAKDQAELTVSLVGDAEIQRLNRTYRGQDRPTDVLAFAMREGVRVPGDERMLGDVVIALPTAARQARERGLAVADEVRTLLIHGVLHLLGYDHERSATEARRMRAMERRLHALVEDAITRRHATCVPRGRHGI